MRQKGKAAAAALGVGLWLICLMAPQPGLAAIRCQQNPEGTVLSISTTGESYAGVRRSGDRIAAFDVISGRRGCESESTVAEIERIKVFAGGAASAELELRKGPFGPGSGEDDASPEIEIEVSGPGYVEVIGGPGPEHFRFMDEGKESGVNLNPDEDQDLDVTVARKFREAMLFVVNGGAGNDRIDAPGAPALEMFATGGAGNDTLTSAADGAILAGERGADRLIGGHAFDFLVPGPGPDLVLGRGASDLVEMKPDRNRDRINCGSGRDFASAGDRFDRIVSCSA